MVFLFLPFLFSMLMYMLYFDIVHEDTQAVVGREVG